ncbi:MAG: hypothetical protein MUP82_08855 [Candidatus Marinimicrobia bacterium]|nr:hypothetical protein [Candidatus Neomarinimicrobiota bacterium]
MEEITQNIRLRKIAPIEPGYPISRAILLHGDYAHPQNQLLLTDSWAT